eukprot:gene4733-3418_t
MEPIEDISPTPSLADRGRVLSIATSFSLRSAEPVEGEDEEEVQAAGGGQGAGAAAEGKEEGETVPAAASARYSAGAYNSSSSPRRSRRTRRTLWLSEASDLDLLVSCGVLPASLLTTATNAEGGHQSRHRWQSPSERRGNRGGEGTTMPKAVASELSVNGILVPTPLAVPDIALTSLRQVKKVLETLTASFPSNQHSASGGSGGLGTGAVWLDFVHPTSSEVATVLSWFAGALPHLLRGTRHWMHLHLEDEAEEAALMQEAEQPFSNHATTDPGEGAAAAFQRLANSAVHHHSSCTGIDHIEYYPSYGYGLLRFTALRDTNREAPEAAAATTQPPPPPPGGKVDPTPVAREELVAAVHPTSTADGSPSSVPGYDRGAARDALFASGEKYKHLPPEEDGQEPHAAAARHPHHHHHPRSSSTGSSTSSTSAQSHQPLSAEDAPLVIVSALLLDGAMLTFRNGYFMNEEEMLPQLQWCMTPAPAPAPAPGVGAHAAGTTSPSPTSPSPAPLTVCATNPRSALVGVFGSPLLAAAPAMTAFPGTGSTTLPIQTSMPPARVPRHILGLLLSTLICAVVEVLKHATVPLMIEANTVDELALAMRPSAEDQVDLLRRMRSIRHRIAEHHLRLLQKDRLVQQLLATMAKDPNRDEGAEEDEMLAQRRTAVELVAKAHHPPSAAGFDAAILIEVTPSPPTTETALLLAQQKREAEAEVLSRYLHALHLTRLAIEHTRRGRDMINLSSMSVISGVVARLGLHCHWMDYLSTLQSQIALLVMPINIIPGIMSCNVRVPFENDTSKSIFWIIVGITMGVLLIGLAYPLYRYYRYALPGSIAPL